MTLPQVYGINGQLYLVAPNQAFMAQRPFIQAPLHQPQVQPQLQPHHNQPQPQLQQPLQLPAPISEPDVDIDNNFDNDDALNMEIEQIVRQRQVLSVEKLNERIKTKAKNIKGNYIGHYIDSQLIIETPEPLKEKKKKKKKKMLAQNQNLDNSQAQQEVAQTHHIAAHNSPSPGQIQSSKQDVKTVNTTDSDILRLREDMRAWSVRDVVKFIESHESIASYSSKFAEDEIDGTALLYMIDRNLNIQVLSTMFKYGPAMKIEATLSKYKLSRE